ncbi:MAG: hypothetical protein CMO55_06280 [Verrucomicrobiales bacterium]|nr:hypothetical protein [Verrucomicrobiales bacterium]
MMNRFAAIPLVAALLLLAFETSLAQEVYQKRDFRPIEPLKQKKVKEVKIKQNVTGGSTQMKQQSITVTIPPPPIPAPEQSLFPEESIPEVDKSLPPSPVFNEIEEDSLPPELEDSTDEETIGNSSEEASAEEGEVTLSLSNLRAEAHKLAQEGLKYSFGADDPESGGLDCSGVVQYLLTKLGVEDCPRTSYDQYYWLKRKKMLDDVYGKSSTKKLLKKLSPGDLIFWGGTWNSGHRVSHVMIYMGYDKDADKHWIFGARSKSSEGMFGNGVDIFELDPNRGRLIACGKIPGLKYDQ